MTYVRVLNGLILVFVGVIFLLINFDRLEWSIWTPLVRLWPLVLVLIGIDLLGQNRSLRFLKALVPILMIAVLAYLFLSYSTPEEVAVSYFEHPRSEVSELEVRLGIEDVRLEIHPDYSGNLISGRLRYPLEADEPETRFETADAEATWQLLFHEWDRSPGVDREREASIMVSEQVALRVQLECAASTCTLDFEDLDVRFARISADVSSVTLNLGTQGEECALVLNGNLAQFEISLPVNCGIHLESEGSLRYTDYPDDLAEISDGVYESPGFESMMSRVRIYSENNLSKMRIARR